MLKYTTNNSGREGQYVKVDLAVSFFPGRFTVVVAGGNAWAKREISNHRPNYLARDIPRDLLARDKWRSFWFGRFAGPVYLDCPRIANVPRELQIHLICSWGRRFRRSSFGLPTLFTISPADHDAEPMR